MCFAYPYTLNGIEKIMFQKFCPLKQMKLSYRKLLLIFFILLYTGQAYAQLDSIRYRLETGAAVSTQGYLPLWLVSNRYGMLDDETDAFVRAGFEAPYTKGKKFDVSYGLDLVGKKNLGNSRIQQGFVKVKYGIFEIRGGRIEETTGLVHKTLSSGSLAQSRNAMPIPKIAFTMPDYAVVPFTKGYLEFKGYWGHGWLGEEQYVQNSLLHEKSLYIKAGGKLPVNFYGGFVHYAVWGGEHPTRGMLPGSVKDYLQVFQGKEGKENSPVAGETTNALGNHLGIYDFGIVTTLDNYKISVYHQTPWETLNSLKLFKNKDRLLGVVFTNNNKGKIVSEILYEYLFTKFQSGPGMPDPREGQSNYGYPYKGRNDYYNNYLYPSGWSYHNMILGSPLFTTKMRAEGYFGEYPDYDEWPHFIVNNRIIAHHIGLGGFLSKNTSYRALATYSINYGTYGGLNLGRYNWASMDPDIDHDYEFNPALNQVYLMIDLASKLPFNENITLKSSLGCDVGQMSRNFGVLLGLQWNGVMKSVL